MLIEFDSESSGSDNYHPYRPGQTFSELKPNPKPPTNNESNISNNNNNQTPGVIFRNNNASNNNNNNANSKFSFGLKNSVLNKQPQYKEPDMDPFEMPEHNQFEVDSKSLKSPPKPQRAPVRLLTNPNTFKNSTPAQENENINKNNPAPKRLLGNSLFSIPEPQPQSFEIEENEDDDNGESFDPFEIADDENSQNNSTPDDAFVMESSNDEETKEAKQPQQRFLLNSSIISPKQEEKTNAEDNSKPKRFLLNNIVKKDENESKNNQINNDPPKEETSKPNHLLVSLQPKPNRLLNLSQNSPQEPPKQDQNKRKPVVIEFPPLPGETNEPPKIDNNITENQNKIVEKNDNKRKPVVIDFPPLPEPPKETENSSKDSEKRKPAVIEFPPLPEPSNDVVDFAQDAGTRIPEKLLKPTEVLVETDLGSEKEEEKHENVSKNGTKKHSKLPETFVDNPDIILYSSTNSNSSKLLRISTPKILEAPKISNFNRISDHEFKSKQKSNEKSQKTLLSNPENTLNKKRLINFNSSENSPKNDSQNESKNNSSLSFHEKQRRPIQYTPPQTFVKKPPPPPVAANVSSRLFDENEMLNRIKQQQEEESRREKPKNVFNGQVSESLFSENKKKEIPQPEEPKIPVKKVTNPIPSFLEREEKRKEELEAEANSLLKKIKKKQAKKIVKNKKINKSKKNQHSSTSNRRYSKLSNDDRIMKDIQSRLKVIKLAKEQEKLQILEEEKIKQQDQVEKERISNIQKEREVAVNENRLRNMQKVKQVISKRDKIDKQRNALVQHVLEKEDAADKRKSELMKKREKDLAKRNAEIWMKQKLMEKQRETNAQKLELERKLKLMKIEERQRKIDQMKQERIEKQKLQKQTIQSILMSLE